MEPIIQPTTDKPLRTPKHIESLPEEIRDQIIATFFTPRDLEVIGVDNFINELSTLSKSWTVPARRTLFRELIIGESTSGYILKRFRKSKVIEFGWIRSLIIYLGKSSNMDDVLSMMNINPDSNSKEDLFIEADWVCNYHGIHYEDFIDLLKKMSALKQLYLRQPLFNVIKSEDMIDLNKLEIFSSITSLKLSNSQPSLVVQLIRKMPKLKLIHIISEGYFSSMNYRFEKTKSQLSFPKLRELRYEGEPNESGFLALFTKETLRRIKVFEFEPRDIYCFPYIGRHVTSLALDISIWTTITEQALRHYPNLEILKVESASSIEDIKLPSSIRELHFQKRNRLLEFVVKLKLSSLELIKIQYRDEYEYRDSDEPVVNEEDLVCPNSEDLFPICEFICRRKDIKLIKIDVPDPYDPDDY